MSTPFRDGLFVTLQYVLPHHFISRMVYAMTRWRSPLVEPAIRAFVKHFQVDMDEAIEASPAAYASFNAFFTRALKPELRPLAAGDEVVACPVDGTISQLGRIQDGRIFQAKGHEFSLVELLGGDLSRADAFRNGQFVTIYLSPKDYHRIHMPLAGSLTQMVHVPGRLFSVNPVTVERVPRLFARNERVAALFDTDAGAMGLVLVGAMNVAAIETIWSGLVTPPHGHEIGVWDYGEYVRVQLPRGAEMGRFNMGSTVILLLPEMMNFRPDLAAGVVVRMGEALAQSTAWPINNVMSNDDDSVAQT
ncbi:MAG: phosphatidylserine decarboxylase [Gammaproteobacteria bacterium 28-57-27]|nr:MAG: phosphatidylserine decarboxylase [Gammaproteobacteria bacterium 28-57-27]